MQNMRRPNIVVQPTPFTCVHACLSMVTGVDVSSIIARFGNRPLGWQSEVAFLVENYIFPVDVPIGKIGDPLDLQGLYLASVPSLNLPGELHRVVVNVDRGGAYLYDPNRGRENAKFYEPVDILKGHVHIVDLKYLDMGVLQELRTRRSATSTEEHF